MQVPAALRDNHWGKWLRIAPPAIVDVVGDAFLADAREWLHHLPTVEPGSWASANLATQDLDEARYQALITAITRYQMALLKCKEDEVSLGTDRLQQAIATTIAGTVGANIATKLGLTALIAGAAFAATAAGMFGIGYAIVSVRRNSVKARRNRMINEIYDALETVIARLSYQ